MGLVNTITNDYIRMMNKTEKPSSKKIMGYIGDQLGTKWLELEKYLKTHYDLQQETIYYGDKYGWTVRYRKSGKTLCSLFPEKGAFTILITLGKKESEQILVMKKTLSSMPNSS